MTWFRVDDGFYDHPKVLDLIDNHKCWKGSITLWTRAGSWCSKHEKDGSVPASTVKILGATTQEALALVSCGLWLKDGSGYVFNGWKERNPLKADLETKRETTRKRVADWREDQARKRVPVDAGNAVTSEYGRDPVTPAPSQTIPDPSLPSPLKREPARSDALDLPRVASDLDPDNSQADPADDQDALDASAAEHKEIRAAVRRGFSKRWEVAQEGMWTRYGDPAVDKVAEWVRSLPGGRVAQLAALERTLDNFFADQWVIDSQFPISDLARRPERYLKPPAHGAPSTGTYRRVSPTRATTAKDFEHEPDFEHSMRILRGEAGA